MLILILFTPTKQQISTTLHSFSSLSQITVWSVMVTFYWSFHKGILPVLFHVSSLGLLPHRGFLYHWSQNYASDESHYTVSWLHNVLSVDNAIKFSDNCLWVGWIFCVNSTKFASVIPFWCFPVSLSPFVHQEFGSYFLILDHNPISFREN